MNQYYRVHAVIDLDAICHNIQEVKRVVGEGLALDIVDTFLETEFSNDERHIRRINQIED